MYRPKVSIIIPVFQAEQYIEKCARSLFEQTLDDLEYIFIDDCSPDTSIEVLKRIIEDYPLRRNQVQLIRNEQNYGVSHSRQLGLNKATGEYVIHCDPDDWVDLNIYEILYREAKANNADMVCCGYYSENADQSIIIHQDLQVSKEDAVYSLLTGKIHGALWNRLINNSFIKENKQCFKKDIEVMEDLLFLVPLYMKTTKIVYVAQPLYHYRRVQNSIVHTINNGIINSYLKVLHIINDEYGRNKIIKEGYLKALAKRSQMLITNTDYYSPERWRSETSEISLKYYPSLKTKLSAWMIRHRLDNLHLLIVNIYSFIRKCMRSVSLN